MRVVGEQEKKAVAAQVERTLHETREPPPGEGDTFERGRAERQEQAKYYFNAFRREVDGLSPKSAGIFNIPLDTSKWHSDEKQPADKEQSQ